MRDKNKKEFIGLQNAVGAGNSLETKMEIRYPERLAGNAENEAASNQEISIRKVSNGYIAVVGCKTFVFTSTNHLFAAIEMYFKNPAKARSIYVRE